MIKDIIFDLSNTANMNHIDIKEWALALSCSQFIERFDLIVSERPNDNNILINLSNTAI